MSADPIAVRLTHRFYRELYQTVRDAGPMGIAPVDLTDRLYRDRSDGGPTSNCIKQVICQRINPRLAPFGIRIWCGTGNSYYRIEIL